MNQLSYAKSLKNYLKLEAELKRKTKHQIFGKRIVQRLDRLPVEKQRVTMRLINKKLREMEQKK